MESWRQVHRHIHHLLYKVLIFFRLLVNPCSLMLWDGVHPECMVFRVRTVLIWTGGTRAYGVLFPILCLFQYWLQSYARAETDLMVAQAVGIVIQQTHGEGQLLMPSSCTLRALCKSALEHGIFLLNLPCFEKEGVRTHFVCLEKRRKRKGKKSKSKQLLWHVCPCPNHCKLSVPLAHTCCLYNISSSE